MGKVFGRQMTQTSNCLFCGNDSFELVLEGLDFDTNQEPFQLTRCLSCGLVRTEVFYEGFNLGSYYPESYYGKGSEKFSFLSELILKLSIRARAIFLDRLITRFFKTMPLGNIKILDFGCGRGLLLKEMARKGFECFGVERKDFPLTELSAGVRFIKGGEDGLRLVEDSFDVVIFWHVLEHLENPFSVLKNVAEKMRPGGVVLISVPNFSSLQARLFKSSWFHIDLPRHIYHFDSKVIESVMQQCGFKTCSRSTFSFVQNVYGFIQSFQNITVSKYKKNDLYRLLQHCSGVNDMIRGLFLCLFAFFLLPLGLLDLLFCSMFGRGANYVGVFRREEA